MYFAARKSKDRLIHEFVLPIAAPFHYYKLRVVLKKKPGFIFYPRAIERC